MPNQRYQALFGASDEVVGEALLDGLAELDRKRLASLLERHRGNVRALVQDLGGHDLGDVLGALADAAIDRRPTVIFAYTIKGFGLPIAGHPSNHSALLAESDIDALRDVCGLQPESEWDAFSPDSLEGRLCAEVAQRLRRPEPRTPAAVAVPAFLSDRDPPRTSTQAAFGRALLGLSRVPDLAERLVTVSPDVSVSTNLGGWINKVGVWAPEEERSYDSGEHSPLRWRVGPRGRHIELGISEMNMLLLIGQLGMTTDYSGEPLYPIGTLYDPFVARALEAMIYSVYSGARFVLAGTPSGISLSREGGAHQSTITPGIGIACPNLTYAEPCFARELEWLLLEGLRRLHEPDGEALYLRLSTKVIDQTPFTDAATRQGEEALRRDILSGGFRLREPTAGGDDAVILAACGAMLPETLEAAALLEEEEGVAATVLALSSPDLIYRDWRNALLGPLRGGSVVEPHLKTLLLPEERGRAVVTVIDGASHALAFLGGALGTKVVPLGVDRFGQVGSQPALYDEYDLSADAIVTAALVALEAN
jgi:pyruvate dehydrogenase E1 component